MSATNENKKGAELKVMGVEIVSKGRPNTMLPFTTSPTENKNKVVIFRQGTCQHVKLTFIVSGDNLVSGLTYNATVWKSGIRVTNRKTPLGNYGPKQEPYIYEFEDEPVPTGFLVRGSYSCRTKLVDDDGKCYLDFTYYFDVQKN